MRESLEEATREHLEEAMREQLEEATQEHLEKATQEHLEEATQEHLEEAVRKFSGDSSLLPPPLDPVKPASATTSRCTQAQPHLSEPTRDTTRRCLPHTVLSTSASAICWSD